MEQRDIERIARSALKELGVAAELEVSPMQGRPGQWRIDIAGRTGAHTLRFTCGKASSPQWVRAQIFEKLA